MSPFLVVLTKGVTRRQGVKRRYFGETSRSPFQRGSEHLREITLGVATHPLVTHFEEEHEGQPLEVLMRILSKHLTPLDRQVRESLNISLAAKQEEECLNLKSEWGGSKLPNLAVTVPKGVGRRQTLGAGDNKENQESDNKGDKRTREPREQQKELEDTGKRPEKKLRDTSPEGKGDNRWRQKPSFTKTDK